MLLPWFVQIHNMSRLAHRMEDTARAEEARMWEVVPEVGGLRCCSSCKAARCTTLCCCCCTGGGGWSGGQGGNYLGGFTFYSPGQGAAYFIDPGLSNTAVVSAASRGNGTVTIIPLF